MAFVVALAALLIVIQDRSLHWATQDAASAYMDATSTKAFGRLQTELTALASLVHVLATSSSLADSNERTETGPAIPLFKAVLQELPQLDSIYAGFENGAWLQVRRIGELNDEQRERLRATPGASTAINLVRPAPDGELPMSWSAKWPDSGIWSQATAFGRAAAVTESPRKCARSVRGR